MTDDGLPHWQTEAHSETQIEMTIGDLLGRCFTFSDIV